MYMYNYILKHLSLYKKVIPFFCFSFSSLYFQLRKLLAARLSWVEFAHLGVLAGPGFPVSPVWFECSASLELFAVPAAAWEFRYC